MEPSKRLAHNLVAESKAYGYTLTIWGSGAILIAHYGVPTALSVAAYAGGALVAMGVLALVAFDGPFAEQTSPTDYHRLAISMVHIAATGGSLVVSYLVSAAGRGVVSPPVAFGVVGFLGTTLYNVLLVFEDAVWRAVGPEE